MKRFISSLLVCLLFTISLPITSVYADENDTVNKFFNQNGEQQAPTNSSPQLDAGAPSFTSLLIRTIIVLALIILLIYGLSKWMTKRNNASQSNSFMQVKSGLNLSQNKSLRLVKVGSSYYLLGIGNDIQLLKEFSSEEEINEIEEMQQQLDETMIHSSKQRWSDFISVFNRKEKKQAENFQLQLEERLVQLRESKTDHDQASNKDDKQIRGE